MIIVKPTGGLGNRMRVINSALCLARDNGQSFVKLNWNANSVLNAAFSHIFEEIPAVQEINFNASLFYRLMKEKFFPSGSDHSKQLWNGYLYYNDQIIIEKRFDENYWMAGHSKAVFNTCFDFYKPSDDNNFYNLFKPVPSLQKRIESMVTHFAAGKTVGVHIRRTDHVDAIAHSKTNTFVERIEELLHAKTISKIYLSTDDKETEKDLVEYFGQCIFYLSNKELNRHTQKGIEDAVVDMYCLANTDMILGSFSSTFSQVAASIKNIPLHIIK